jgi:hypothetical protein
VKVTDILIQMYKNIKSMKPLLKETKMVMVSSTEGNSWNLFKMMDRTTRVMIIEICHHLHKNSTACMPTKRQEE